ncbi:MAG: alcohol dehydrogenase catalytic domain-containing protein [Gemmatimonadetes bacterium]|nr:alcohol dehydrogenase catalytic domain-containing protein [Gemmatimonadota bacterium]
MRALSLTATGGPEHLAVLDLPAPRLQAPDEVRIGVRAIALNRLDLWVANGLPAAPIKAFPHIVGADAAGVVLEVGPAVTSVQVGDRVVVNPGVSCGQCTACLAGDEVFCRHFGLLGEHRPGTAAEEIVLPARNVARLDGGVELGRGRRLFPRLADRLADADDPCAGTGGRIGPHLGHRRRSRRRRAPDRPLSRRPRRGHLRLRRQIGPGHGARRRTRAPARRRR